MAKREPSDDPDRKEAKITAGEEKNAIHDLIPGLDKRVDVKSSMLDEIESSKLMLKSETVLVIDEIAQNVRLDSHAVVVQLGESKDIHEALKLKSSPIPQAKDEESSVLALREWLLSHVRDAGPGFVLTESKSGDMKNFGIRVSYTELADIVVNRWLGGKNPGWMQEMKASIPGKTVTLLMIIADEESSNVHLSYLANFF